MAKPTLVNLVERIVPEPVSAGQPEANAYSHTRLADEIFALHGADMRYVPALGRWIHWAGTHWQYDELRRVLDLFTTIARSKAEIGGPFVTLRWGQTRGHFLARAA